MVTFLARHAPPSRQIISHVRNATTGSHSLENTQPFVRRLAGRAHVFAHNGHVPGTKIPAGSSFLRPLDDQCWTPLAEGEIGCFEQGRRVA
jgi:hypothetical protein